MYSQTQTFSISSISQSMYVNLFKKILIFWQNYWSNITYCILTKIEKGKRKGKEE